LIPETRLRRLTVHAIVGLAIPAISVAAVVAVPITERPPMLAMPLLAAEVAAPARLGLVRRCSRSEGVVDRGLRISSPRPRVVTPWCRSAHVRGITRLVVTLFVGDVVPFELVTGKLRAIAVELAVLGLQLADLLPVRHDDAIVMLGVLEIAFCQNRIARRLRVAGELDVFLGDMHRIAADFYIRSVRLETASKRILVFPIGVVMIAIVVRAAIATAATAHMLLSLPHAHHVSIVVKPKSGIPSTGVLVARAT
jgi:hypothetical protein